MRRSNKEQRSDQVAKLSYRNRWYEYERKKKHLGPAKWEAEVKGLAKGLRL